MSQSCKNGERIFCYGLRDISEDDRSSTCTDTSETESRRSSVIQPGKDEVIVHNREAGSGELEEDEPEGNPARRIGIFRKYVITTLLASCAFQVTCLSTTWSQAIISVSEDMSVNKTIATLGVTLFIIGQGIGPLLFTPISEIYGRRKVYLVALTLYCIFQLMPALGHTLPIMLVGRFFSGFAGGTFITVISGTFSDMFEQKDIGIPTLMFSMAPFLGPGIGPMIGATINTNLGYRWIFKVMLLWSVGLLVLVALLVPETFLPVLQKKHSSPANKPKNIAHLCWILIKSAKKPLKMVATDPIIFFTSFASGIYLALIYLFFVAYPLIFEDIYHFRPVSTGYTFLGMTCGMLLTIPTRRLWVGIYKYLARTRNDGVGMPEYRLPQMLTGTVTSFIGLLLFAFTIRASIHWMVPIASSGIFGFGCLLVFNGVFAYVFEAYPKCVASASACNLFFRSVMAGIFPLFGATMFRRLTPRWACVLLAGVTLVMSLAPILFFKYGRALREASKLSN